MWILTVEDTSVYQQVAKAGCILNLSPLIELEKHSEEQFGKPGCSGRTPRMQFAQIMSLASLAYPQLSHCQKLVLPTALNRTRQTGSSHTFTENTVVVTRAQLNLSDLLPTLRLEVALYYKGRVAYRNGGRSRFLTDSTREGSGHLENSQTELQFNGSSSQFGTVVNSWSSTSF
jgi:hypothetical protein